MVDENQDPLAGSRADCRINKYRLDDECSEQSSKYLYYSELQAGAKDQESSDQDALERIKAEVEMKIRENPPEGVKITEGSVKALVDSSKEVEEARKRLREARNYRHRVDAVVNSLGHRKAMLDDLTVLWSKGYYMVDTGHIRSGSDAAQEDLRKNLHRLKEGE